MSPTEEQELRDKINRLTNRINRHKEQSNGSNHGQDYSGGGRGLYHRSAPYPQQSYRGRGGRYQPTYRNRTLVLNGGVPSSASNQENHVQEPTTPSWVTRTDRHLQLINRNVYERESQQRTQAIEQTLQQKRLDKDRREKAQFLKNMQHVHGDVMAASSNSSKPASRYEVDVEGVRFHVTQQGSKLVKAPDDLNPPTATPKEVSLYGVKFHRTKNGNLIRHAVVQAQRRAGRIKKVNERCKAFSWTGIVFLQPNRAPTSHLILQEAVLARKALRAGTSTTCPRLLSAELGSPRVNAPWAITAICLTRLRRRGRRFVCIMPKGLATIRRARTSTLSILRLTWSAGRLGSTGTAIRALSARRATFSNVRILATRVILRKANKRGSSEEMEDVSSEDEDMVDSDDVDSDEAEEFIGHDDYDPSFAEQKDFIGYTYTVAPPVDYRAGHQ
ncbi:hypothetical protein NPX13_g9363 [Xylaria arbuscula]|uniref:Uncharacterized protein n=1 Tax=Xylaria arbuscula TaxID=114810 RepID=A0A9W8TJ47_9PEZI|nr:hypothetical protein NPX13_g9363 [Xylaria arbuscula]